MKHLFLTLIAFFSVVIPAFAQVTSQSSVQSFELPQFHGVQLKGNCEEEKCVYSYLLAKDGSCGFYVSIVYRQENDKTPETILKSFHMEE